MNHLRKLILGIAVMTMLPLAGCGTSCKILTDTNELLATPVTDSLKLTSSYEGKKFTQNLAANGERIGEVTVKSFTDGDTANFTEVGNPDTIKLRFLAINTPESTAKVEPWGKKASIFTKHKLETAKTIVLQNDVNVFGERDGSGNRWLGFVWYNTADNAEFRLLNLEIVEQCYSTNQLFKDSSICNYRSYFEKAEANGKACGYRVHGTQDPDYDYNKTYVEISLRELITNYDEYGISEAGSSGKQLRITAFVEGMAGDNLFVRDVKDEDPTTGKYSALYTYAGYGSSLASIVSVGYVVNFYCRGTKFNGNIQLSDVKYSTYGKTPFTVVATPESADYADYHPSLVPTDMNTAAFTAYTDFAPYALSLIKTKITIRTVTDPEEPDASSTINSTAVEPYYYKKDDNNNMTVYAWSEAEGLTLNLRVDGTCFPYPSETLFAVGKSYYVTGFLSPYFEKYQLQLFNNNPTMNYIVPVE